MKPHLLALGVLQKIGAATEWPKNLQSFSFTGEGNIQWGVDSLFSNHPVTQWSSFHHLYHFCRNLNAGILSVLCEENSGILFSSGVSFLDSTAGHYAFSR